VALMPKPEHIDLTNATRIAFASNQPSGKERWFELGVYWLGDPQFRRMQWLAELKHCSSIEGDRQPRTVRHAGVLSAVLKHFEDSRLGVDVKEQARTWQSENQAMVDDFYQALRTPGRGDG